MERGGGPYRDAPPTLGARVRSHGPRLNDLGAHFARWGFYVAASGSIRAMSLGGIAGLATLALDGVVMALAERSRRARNVELILHEHGFVHRADGVRHTLLWDRIRAVRATTVHFTFGRETRCELETDEGALVALSHLVDGIDALASRIEREVAARRTGVALSAIDRGEKVSFGAVSISKAGLARLNGPRLPRERLGTLEDVPERDRVVVHLRGGDGPWASIPRFSVSNVPIAIAAAAHVARTAD